MTDGRRKNGKEAANKQHRTTFSDDGRDNLSGTCPDLSRRRHVTRSRVVSWLSGTTCPGPVRVGLGQQLLSSLEELSWTLSQPRPSGHR